MKWQSLKHENILPILGVGAFGNGSCLVSPLAENGEILNYLQKHDSDKTLVDLVSRDLLDFMWKAPLIAVFH